MLASTLAMVSWLDAASTGVPSVTAFTGVPTAMLLKAAAPPRSSAALLLPSASGSVRPRFASPVLASASASMFHAPWCHQQHHHEQEAEERRDDDRDYCRRTSSRRSRSTTTVYCCTRRDHYSTQRSNMSRSDSSPASPPSNWSIGGHSSFREAGNSLSGGGGGGGGGGCTQRSRSGDVGSVIGAATRMRRQTSRLMAAAGRDGEEGETPHPDDEDEQQDRASARPRSREEAFYGSSIPASKRGPPEEDDIWSKHSVFEFKSLNDPDTNASCYKGLTGQRGGPSAAQRASESRPGPELRLTSRARPAFDEDLEAERSRGSEEAEASANDLFRFREKEALARKRSEVERTRRRGSTPGGSTASTAVRVELATQLGLPATASFDELRAAYRVEVKRCHPDMAGDNEFRVKLLERRFQRLRLSWDSFVEEQTAEASGRSSRAEATTGNPQAQAARERARARAQAEERAQQEAVTAAAAAAAVAKRGGRRVVDPGRQIFDAGGPSC